MGLGSRTYATHRFYRVLQGRNVNHKLNLDHELGFQVHGQCSYICRSCNILHYIQATDHPVAPASSALQTLCCPSLLLAELRLDVLRVLGGRQLAERQNALDLVLGVELHQSQTVQGHLHPQGTQGFAPRVSEDDIACGLADGRNVA